MKIEIGYTDYETGDLSEANVARLVELLSHLDRLGSVGRDIGGQWVGAYYRDPAVVSLRRRAILPIFDTEEEAKDYLARLAE